MAKITCINEKILEYGATISLNAKDSEGNYIPDFRWEKNTVEKDKTSAITEGSAITFNTIVDRQSSFKPVSEFMIETNNFE